MLWFAPSSSHAVSFSRWRSLLRTAIVSGMLAGSLSSLVPVPGGFGAFHYIVAAALTSIYGVPFGMGIVFATLSHESQTITQLICGLWSYISESGQFIKDK